MDHIQTLTRTEGKNEYTPTYIMSPSNISFMPKADQKIEK